MAKDLTVYRKLNMEHNSEIIIYQTSDSETRIQTRLQDETVWLTQEQMAVLFGKDRTTVNRHISNIFNEEELDEKVVCAFFAHTTKHGAIEGENEGNRSIWFNGKNTKEQTEHIKPQIEKYAVTDFCRILEDNPDE